MKKKEIIQVIQKRVKKISRLSEDINNDFDGEDIHKFRVSVKKLRAFLRLVQLHDDNAPGLTNKFKYLYHISGHIRDNELFIEKILDKKLVMPDYLDLLHGNVAHYKKEWKNHYSGKIVKKLEYKLTDYDYYHLPPTVLDDFIKKSIADLNEASTAPHLSNDNIHSLRKTMKDMLYISAFTRKEWPHAYDHIKGISVEKLEQLTDMIGQFNDERLSLGQMAEFALHDISIKEKNRIGALCHAEANILAEKKKSIIAATRDFLKEVQTDHPIAG